MLVAYINTTTKNIEKWEVEGGKFGVNFMCCLILSTGTLKYIVSRVFFIYISIAKCTYTNTI